MRIVSLLPSATEIVYALGLGDQLEGAHGRMRTRPGAAEADRPVERTLRPRSGCLGISWPARMGATTG
jgi:hypothetical protein